MLTSWIPSLITQVAKGVSHASLYAPLLVLICASRGCAWGAASFFLIEKLVEKNESSRRIVSPFLTLAGTCQDTKWNHSAGRRQVGRAFPTSDGHDVLPWSSCGCPEHAEGLWHCTVVLRSDDKIIYRNFVFRRRAVHAQSTLATNRPQTHSKWDRKSVV